MAEFQLGSISTGTLRTEDLIPAFRAALEATGNQGTLALHETPVDERDELATLEIALQEACPPFVYFGAHPGDGADFGFWPDMESLNEELQRHSCKDSACDTDEQHTLIDEELIVYISDHGNVTVMDMDRNVLWSVV
jgi:hypothetical protein